MSITAMLIWYAAIVAFAILILCSRGVPAAVKGAVGFVLVVLMLAVIIATVVHFSVKAGLIRF